MTRRRNTIILGLWAVQSACAAQPCSVTEERVVVVRAKGDLLCKSSKCVHAGESANRGFHFRGSKRTSTSVFTLTGWPRWTGG
jgi:hypothetical protein